MFTLPRIAGWLSHWSEFIDDPVNNIVRPRQIYKGYTKRDYVPENRREVKTDYELEYKIDSFEARREASLDYAKAHSQGKWDKFVLNLHDIKHKTSLKLHNFYYE